LLSSHYCSNGCIAEALVSPSITQPIGKWGSILAAANVEVLTSLLMMESGLGKQEFIGVTA